MSEPDALDAGYTVPCDWVRNTLEVLNLPPNVQGDVLGRAGLHWSDLSRPGEPIAQRRELAFLTALAQYKQNTYFGAEIGLQVRGRTSTLVSYVVHASRNVHEAITNSSRLLALTRPGAITRVEREGGAGTWHLDNHDPWVQQSPIYQEYVTSLVLTSLRTGTGKPLRPLLVNLRSSSQGRVPRLRHIWECEVSTDQDRHAISFSDGVMDLPMLDFDGPLLQHLRSYGEMMLASLPASEPDLRLQVERTILSHLVRGAPPVSVVAADLGMSVRTLTRRLTELGLSYRGLLDDVRMRKSKLMLRDGTLSLAEIAFVLGYSEQSSFTNAFRRWTGMAPGTFRSEQRTASGQSAGGRPAP